MTARCALAVLAVATTLLAAAVASTAGVLALPAGAAAPAAAGGVDDIPATYLAAFDAAAARTGVPWAVLAGIYRVECDFGESRLPGCPPGTENAAGAQGPGQFLPGTWRAGSAPTAIIAPGPPAAAGGGWASDGDGDGVADAWDPWDATLSTARMLAADGAPGDTSAAVFAYDHDPTYVTEVLALAARYQADRSAAGPPAGAPPGAPAGVAEVLSFARAQLGQPYLWGGSGAGGWDCSGLVQAAFARVGVVLTHDAAAQYQATSGHPVPLGSLRPGDLVFYGTAPPTIHHVGIAVDATHMIDAPHTGAVVRVDPVAAGDLLAATRPLG